MIYPLEVKVYCMVRAKDDDQAASRLKNDMETALVWNSASIQQQKHKSLNEFNCQKIL